MSQQVTHEVSQRLLYPLTVLCDYYLPIVELESQTRKAGIVHGEIHDDKETTAGKITLERDASQSISSESEDDTDYDPAVGSSTSSDHNVAILGTVFLVPSQTQLFIRTEVIPRLLALARQVTFVRLEDILWSGKIQFAEDARESWSRISLQVFPKADILHTFDEEKRCSYCDKQLCKECRYCLLQHCKAAISTPPAGRLLESSMSVRRILARCGQDGCPMKPLVGQETCSCTEFLIDGFHNCESKKGHYCSTCLEYRLSLLSKKKTKIVDLVNSSEVGMKVYRYICPNGKDFNPDIKPASIFYFPTGEYRNCLAKPTITMNATSPTRVPPSLASAGHTRVRYYDSRNSINDAGWLGDDELNTKLDSIAPLVEISAPASQVPQRSAVGAAVPFVIITTTGNGQYFPFGISQITFESLSCICGFPKQVKNVYLLRLPHKSRHVHYAED
ncbi:hypothetical protein DL98DRAFT_618728 [Cadophora sp. DSE1049]|nr:hypothetical protein DL98DRAFT_618728 [Cadophora sp. DSE1049]